MNRIGAQFISFWIISGKQIPIYDPHDPGVKKSKHELRILVINCLVKEKGDPFTFFLFPWPFDGKKHVWSLSNVPSKRIEGNSDPMLKERLAMSRSTPETSLQPFFTLEPTCLVEHGMLTRDNLRLTTHMYTRIMCDRKSTEVWLTDRAQRQASDV